MHYLSLIQKENPFKSDNLSIKQHFVIFSLFFSALSFNFQIYLSIVIP